MRPSESPRTSKVQALTVGKIRLRGPLAGTNVEIALGGGTRSFTHKFSQKNALGAIIGNWLQYLKNEVVHSRSERIEAILVSAPKI